MTLGAFATAALLTPASTTPTPAASPLENMTTTWNGAKTHSTTGSARVDLYYAASRNVDKDRLLQLLQASYTEHKLDTLKIVAYCRDIRGGKGERLLTRHMLTWLASNATDNLKFNLEHYVGEYGRFDDVLALMGTPLEIDGLKLWGNQLCKDLEILNKGEGSEGGSDWEVVKEGEGEGKEKENRKVGISLVAKWIPSEKKKADKECQVNKKLVKVMGLKNASELRKTYLSPLRRRLDILEKRMCEKDWEGIQFGKVPSVAMKIHGRKGKAFERNAEERFKAYKEGLATGKEKVNAKALFPHEIVKTYIDIRNPELDELVEAQWKVMLEKGSALGDLSNVLVMSDVSGSMSGLPMQISIALGILVSQLTSLEWKGLVMTFEAAPKFHKVQGETLRDQVNCLKHAPWGGNTDFIKALELILLTARNSNIAKEAMPKRLIVVSDMQFDYASGGNTNYQTLLEKYEKAGYDVPHIVFWNVNGATSDFPTTNAMPNVSLISGYSVDVIKAVLKGDEITPFTTMINAIHDERYNKICLPPC